MSNCYTIIGFIVFSTLNADVLPLTQRYFHQEDQGHSYTRGTYMIILSDASLETFLRFLYASPKRSITSGVEPGFRSYVLNS